MGGGILPVSIYKGKIYFLFSREYINSKDDGGLWSDFGGSKYKNETYSQTAIREGWEESDGILGNKKNIEKLIKNKTLKHITIGGYRTYIILIDYDRTLPRTFRNNFLKIKNEKPHLIAKQGMYEKDMLKWVSYNDIKNKKFYNFRRWYKSIVKEIIKLF